MSTTESGPPPDLRDWEAVQSSPEFQDLRRRLRTFVFPLTGLFLVWYLLYVLLANYAAPFMSYKLFGNVNVGLVFGLLQFVSTFVITWWYGRFAAQRLDPLAGKLRSEMDGRPEVDGSDSEAEVDR